MKQPAKWRETIDPFSLKFNNFELIEVLGYPHERNDVFYCKGIFKTEEIYCFIKYAKTKESNLKRETEIVLKLFDKFNRLPEIIDFDNDGQYIITREVVGERLSYILEENPKENPIDYMFEYGKTLGQIHKIDIECEEMKHRKFFDIPSSDNLKENEIEFVECYLKESKPKSVNRSFCHGDFHFANVLWKDKALVGVLDWELAGIGNKEFDVAWAIINRPSQKFLKTEEEVQEFLRGYKSENDCNANYVEYYMVLIYSHFISVDKNNSEYREFVRNILYKYV